MGNSNQQTFSGAINHEIFETQDKCESSSRKLFYTFFGAVLLSGFFMGSMMYSITHPYYRYSAWIHLVSGACHMMIAVVITAMFFRRNSNGSKIASSEGASPITRALDQTENTRLERILDELSIASGTPKPEVFIEDDSSINSRAVGTKTKDFWGAEVRNFAIILTSGAIKRLNDLELQALLAHEMGHIVNDDISQNMHLMAYCRSLKYFPLVGGLYTFYYISNLYWEKWLLKSRYHRFGLGDGIEIFVVILVNIIPLVIASIFGFLLARFIQKRFLRKREFLADTYAIQFTRTFEGIKGLLAKVAESNCSAKKSSIINAHMFFHHKSQFGALSTHPSLTKRLASIQKLEAKNAKLNAAKKSE